MGPIPPRSLGRHRTLGGRGPAFSQNRPAPSGRAALATLCPPEPDPTAGPARSAPLVPGAPPPFRHVRAGPRRARRRRPRGPARPGRAAPQPPAGPHRGRRPGPGGLPDRPLRHLLQQVQRLLVRRHRRLRQRQPQRGVVRRLRRLGLEAGRRRGVLPAGARATSTATPPASTSGAPTTAPGTRSARGYTPQPGDVAVYGLDTSAVTAVHVAVVIAATGNDAAPDVINGDGDRRATAWSRSATTRPSPT